jgi:hypothetical protein
MGSKLKARRMEKDGKHACMYTCTDLSCHKHQDATIWQPTMDLSHLTDWRQIAVKIGVKIAVV